MISNEDCKSQVSPLLFISLANFCSLMGVII